MPRPKGMQKSGGRARGTPNRASQRRQAQVAASGLSPLDFLIATLRNESLDLPTRLEAARAAAPFVHPFDAPPGHVAFTLDVAGAAPVSVCIPIAELEGLMSDFTQRADGAQLDDLEWHARARICIAEMFMTGGADYKENAALIGFWLTLNHPATNADLKRKLSEQIRDHDCAHVTMAIGPSGMMSTAVSDSFVDL